MKSSWSVLLLATLVACASAGNSTREATRPAEGLYEFSANTPNQLIRGNIRMDSSGTGVQFETACQTEATVRGMPSGMPSSTGMMRYYCSGAWLTFDRRNPQTAKWFATVPIPRRREVCARYDTVNGRQVCASRTTETYYVYETRSGGIQVRRVS